MPLDTPVIQNRYKYIISAASYRDNSGGAIVTHKLCHLINELGFDAYLLPITRSEFAVGRRLFHSLSNKMPAIRAVTKRGFLTNPRFNTPLLPFGLDLKPRKTINIYPDVIHGNPLKAQRIVRWFLHKPGFHTGKTEFGQNEFHIDFNQFLLNYQPAGNYVSPSKLHVLHFPFETYNQIRAAAVEDRQGAAYCVRKGTVDPSVDLSDAICIDGLEHAEIAQIFKKVKYFYSFDPYTAYSYFAAISGAISLVVAPGMRKEDWYQNEADRYGIGFGIDDESWAVTTRHLVAPLFQQREDEVRQTVQNFIHETHEFFG